MKSPGTIYGLSSKGWIDSELFYGSAIFFAMPPPPPPPPPRARPLLLLLDGHSSHFCPDTVRLAAQEQVVVFALPPNTTHLSQSLDKGCFGPLKAEWRNVCHRYISEHPGKVVTRYTFFRLFCQAWMKSMTIGNIVGGFRVTGIYPINRSVFTELTEPKESLTCRTGLAFIPLYSPARHPRKVTSDVPFSEEEVAKFETSVTYGQWTLYTCFCYLPVCLSPFVVLYLFDQYVPVLTGVYLFRFSVPI